MNKKWYKTKYVPGEKNIYGNPKTDLVHRLVMAKHLGRKLRGDEIVHHIDGNGLNNDLSNLELMSRSEHSKIHARIRTGNWDWLKKRPVEKYTGPRLSAGYIIEVS